MQAKQSQSKHRLVTTIIQQTVIYTDASVIAVAYVDHSNFNHIHRWQLRHVNTQVIFPEM